MTTPVPLNLAGTEELPLGNIYSSSEETLFEIHHTSLAFEYESTLKMLTNHAC